MIKPLMIFFFITEQNQGAFLTTPGLLISIFRINRQLTVSIIVSRTKFKKAQHYTRPFPFTKVTAIPTYFLRTTADQPPPPTIEILSLDLASTSTTSFL